MLKNGEGKTPMQAPRPSAGGGIGLDTAAVARALGASGKVNGDVLLVAAEVNPVIRTLREHGIEVTALHCHLLEEEPRLFFMHFWANGDATKLARGLRAALDPTTSGGSP
jgi:hypothetical protein